MDESQKMLPAFHRVAGKQLCCENDNKKNKSKTYYDNHREKVLEKCKIKKTCDACDCKVSSANWSRHVKSGGHQNKLTIQILKEKLEKMTQNPVVAITAT